jgi:hypothetical protein
MKPLPRSDPYLEQWLEYRSIVSSFHLDIIETLGNHDTWGVLSSTSPKNYCLKYAKIGSNSDFYSLTFNRPPIRFVTFEPYDFPTASGLSAYWLMIRDPMLTKLESALTARTNLQTILISHHPSFGFWPQSARSSHGRSFRDLMANVSLYINGHFHPMNPTIHPFGRTIEITAPAIKRTAKYQIIAVDNSRISYHSLEADVVRPAIVTMPVPFKQSSRIFRDLVSEVRVIAFTSEPMHFEVSGDAFGVLDRIKELKPEVWLYSMPIRLTAGMHRIWISGDLNTEIEFAVNCEIPSYTYISPNFVNCWAVIFSFALFAVFHLIILIGMFLGDSSPDVIQKTYEWMRGESDEMHWITAWLCGPLVMGYGMKRLPIWAKCVVAGGFLWGMLLPAGFFKIEETVAAIWICSYIVNGKVMPEMMFVIFPLAYFFLVFFSFVCVLTLYGYKWSWFYLIDGIVALIALGGGITVWMIVGTHTADHSLWVASPEFIILPIVFIVVEITVYARRKTQMEIIRLKIEDLTAPTP